MTQPSYVRYKWTRANRKAIYGVTDYPQIGRWSERRTPVLCESGWHVLTLDNLSVFIMPELWEVRVKGAFASDGCKESWEYVRFVRRVNAWDKDGMLAFVKFCRPENWRNYTAAAYGGAATAATAAAAAYVAAYVAAAARKSQSEWIMQNIIQKGQ